MLGQVFADHVAVHPGEPLTGHTPANYTQRGEAWNRDASVEFFEPSGVRAMAQPVQLDIKGQSTRSFRQKSFGLAARTDSGGPGRFEHALFPGLGRLGDGAPLEQFRSLRLRNMGNDWAYAAMRDAYLAARFDDVRVVGARLLRNITKTPYQAFKMLPAGTVVLAAGPTAVTLPSCVLKATLRSLFSRSGRSPVPVVDCCTSVPFTAVVIAAPSPSGRARHG